jgi:hypothetical protein
MTKNIFADSDYFAQVALASRKNVDIVVAMQDAIDIPADREGCKALILAQAATIREQELLIAKHAAAIDELTSEMEKLRKLLSHFVNGHRSEKRIPTGPDQAWLPFENSDEFQAARAEAEAQAEVLIDAYQRRKQTQKKPKDESLPSHLRRVEEIVPADDSQKICDTHGERTIIGYDTTETLVHVRPELYVLLKKYEVRLCGEPQLRHHVASAAHIAGGRRSLRHQRGGGDH